MFMCGFNHTFYLYVVKDFATRILNRKTGGTSMSLASSFITGFIVPAGYLIPGHLPWQQGHLGCLGTGDNAPVSIIQSAPIISFSVVLFFVHASLIT